MMRVMKKILESGIVWSICNLIAHGTKSSLHMNQNVQILWGFHFQILFVTKKSISYFFTIVWIVLALQYVFEDCIWNNQYATERGNKDSTIDGPQLEAFIVSEFKAYIAIWLYMGMKRQPNIKNYWMKEGLFFHYPLISNILIPKCFLSLNKCLYITNPLQYSDSKNCFNDDIFWKEWCITDEL
jgi:hypothetical protein